MTYCLEQTCSCLFSVVFFILSFVFALSSGSWDSIFVFNYCFSLSCFALLHNELVFYARWYAWWQWMTACPRGVPIKKKTIDWTIVISQRYEMIKTTPANSIQRMNEMKKKIDLNRYCDTEYSQCSQWVLFWDKWNGIWGFQYYFYCFFFILFFFFMSFREFCWSSFLFLWWQTKRMS